MVDTHGHAVLGVSAPRGAVGSGSMDAWEYLIVALPPFEPAQSMKGHSSAVDALNREGTDGWEAVGMTTLPDLSIAVLLKRRSGHDPESLRERPGQQTT